MKSKEMYWPVTVMANTHTPAGRRVRMNRLVEGAGDVEAAMLRAVTTRRGGAAPFLGCELVAVTQIGQVMRRVLDVLDGQYCLVNPYRRAWRRGASRK